MNDDETRNLLVVRQFLDSMAPNWLDFTSSIDASCTPDCVWDNVGTRVARGTTAMKALVHSLAATMGCGSIEVEYGAMVSSSDIVMVERVDIVIDRRGRRIGSLPIVGVFRLEAGLIARWTEYFDPRLLTSRP